MRSWKLSIWETDFRSLIEGDRKYNDEDDLGQLGYTEQEFKEGELAAVEQDEDDFDMDDEEPDDFGYDDLSDDI